MTQPERDDLPVRSSDFDIEAQPRRKSSNTTKVVLVTLLVGTVVMCCGGFAFLGVTGYMVARNAKMTVANTPAEKQQLGRSIATIDLPESYEAAEAFETSVMGFDMKLVNYQRADRPGTRLFLMRNSMLPATASEAERKQVLQQMQGQMNRGPQGRVVESKIETIEIDGEEVAFQLRTLDSAAGKQKELVGVVPLEDGAVVVIFIAPENDFDLDEAKAMLSTLRKGSSTTATEAEARTETAVKTEAEATTPTPAAEPAGATNN